MLFRNLLAASLGVAALMTANGGHAQNILDLLIPKTVCFIRHPNRPPTAFTGPDGRAVGLTPQQCAKANEEALQADLDAQQEAQRQREAQAQQAAQDAQAARKAAAGIAPSPAASNPWALDHKVVWSEKVEADNGEAYFIDLGTVQNFANAVIATVYARGAHTANKMEFYCAQHLVGDLYARGTPIYAPPRSVGARLSAIACAEAERHPEH